MIKVMELFIGICTLRSKNDQVGDRIGRDKHLTVLFMMSFCGNKK